jgi:hypothetical protein
MAKTADQARMEASKVKPAKIKVPQSVIDDIKKMGMTKALAGAKNANPVMAEALTRMYGARRVAAAKGTSATVAKSADAARAGATKPATKAAIKAVSTKVATKAKPKANNTKSNILKGVAGTVAAVGLLAASKGKAAGVAAKLSPAVGGLSKSAVGKAIFGKGEVLTNKALSTSGRVAAKAGKSVTQSQYDAMTAAAKAAGKTAAKTTTKAAAKTPAKTADAARAVASVPKKKLAVAGTGVGSVTLKGDKGKKK